MNNLGALGLLLIAVIVAAFLVLIGLVVALLGRNLMTGRPAWTQAREWLVYPLIATIIIAAFAASYFYAQSKGINEYTINKWMSIVITAVFVFGNAVKRCWRFRTQWTFWVALGVLAVGHFALLSRFRWQQGSYFWLIVVVGIPELTLVLFLLELMLNPNGRAKARSPSSQGQKPD